MLAAFNAGGFLITAAIKSEVVTDLIGTGAIGVTGAVLASQPGSSSRAVLTAGAVGLWSLKLSLFLAYRAFLYGDKRLKEFFPPEGGSWLDHKDRLGKLAGFWVGQTVWGAVLLAPLMAMKRAPVANIPLMTGWPGLVIAGAGLAIETVADYQKFKFKQEHGEKKIMTSGLYSVVQYPNYSGELLLWTGMGIYWTAGAVNPLIAFLPLAFSALILIKVTGINMSEQSRAKHHGLDPFYLAYRSRTKWLIPGLY